MAETGCLKDESFNDIQVDGILTLGTSHFNGEKTIPGKTGIKTDGATVTVITETTDGILDPLNDLGHTYVYSEQSLVVPAITQPKNTVIKELIVFPINGNYQTGEPDDPSGYPGLSGGLAASHLKLIIGTEVDGEDIVPETKIISGDTTEGQVWRENISLHLIRHGTGIPQDSLGLADNASGITWSGECEAFTYSDHNPGKGYNAGGADRNLYLQFTVGAVRSDMFNYASPCKIKVIIIFQYISNDF